MAVDTPSQSMAKAAGDVARGRSRGTGPMGRAPKRTLATHWYSRAMVAPVVF
ncbi:sugar ABC transporter permease, partial [Streptomyces hydrogenans]